MKSKILTVIGILLHLIGLICFAICIVQTGKNTALLTTGLACNSIAFVINYIIQRTKREDK